LLRFAKMDDVLAMTEYMNEISKEDTFIRFSGEQLTVEEETVYLTDVIKKMEQGIAVKVLAFIDSKMVGNADVVGQEKRSKHVAVLGLTVKKDFRNEGIGKEMLVTLIDLAKQMGFLQVRLSCFANNTLACDLYKAFGFSVVGQIPKQILYKGDYVDELIMTKPL